MKNYIAFIASALFCILPFTLSSFAKANHFDVVVYGGTSAGVIAAVEASKRGLSTVIIEPLQRVGGMTSNGLGMTDHGKKSGIGGSSLSFYKLIAKEYGKTGTPQWSFEAKVANKVYQDLIKAHNISVYYGERLDLKSGVTKKQKKIVRIKMESGLVVSGKMFIDASYEGDLMALSGVSYMVGREPNSHYGEELNGIVGREHHLTVPRGVDPYIEAGNPSSGLLPRVNANLGGSSGDGDNKVMAYCYRMNLTNDPDNRVMVQKPEGYNELDYELLFRSLENGLGKTACFQLTRIPNNKVDANMASGISTNYVGGNWDYPEADYETRAKIVKAHETYQKGYVWTVQNHPRIPEEVREHYKGWGLPKDEFTETNHWPEMLYVRESRRMISDYVVTENEIFQRTAVPRSVGLASYAIDSHPVQYAVGDDGFVRTEGGTLKRPPKAYQLDYGVIIPKRKECENLLVPVCVSASHSAYTSLRMEPVFMILGQSAAIAASIAIDENLSVQEIQYATLQRELLRAGQVLMDIDEDQDWKMDDSRR